MPRTLKSLQGAPEDIEGSHALFPNLHLSPTSHCPQGIPAHTRAQDRRTQQDQVFLLLDGSSQGAQ